jgi:hypothetical protein
MGGPLGMKSVSMLDIDNFMDWQMGQQERIENPRELYAAVAWTFWAINLRCDSAAAIPYSIYTMDSDEDTEENEVKWPIELSPLLWLTEAWLQLEGAAYWLKRRNRVVIKDLQVLNATTMKILTYDAEGPVTFRQTVGGKTQDYPAEDVVYFHTFSPTRDLGPGTASGNVSAEPAGLIRNANQYASSFFANGAVPLVLLTTEGAVPENTKAEIRNTWTKLVQGVKKAFSTVVLEHGLTPTVISPPLKDMTMPELETTKRQQILVAHKIPQGMGEPSSNRATQEWLQFEFWTQCVLPEMRVHIIPILDKQLLNPLGLRIGFRFNVIEAIQRVEIDKALSTVPVMQEMVASYQAKVVNLDETRRTISTILEWMSLPKLDDEWEPEPEPAPVIVNVPPPAPEEVPVAEEPTGETPPTEETIPKALAPSGATSELWSDLARWKAKAQKRGRSCDFNNSSIPDWLTVTVKAAMVEVGVERAFDFLKAIPAARLAAERALKAKVAAALAAYRKKVQQAIMRGETIDWGAFMAELRKAIQPELTALMTQQALRTSGGIGVGFDPAIINLDVARWARAYTYELVKGIVETTRSLVSEVIATFIETPGMTQGDMELLLEPAFGAVRAEMIATTETTRAYSAATNETQKLVNESGLPMHRIWITEADELVCDICGPLHLKTEDEWANRFPDGPPGHVNCRCHTELTID